MQYISQVAGKEKLRVVTHKMRQQQCIIIIISSRATIP